MQSIQCICTDAKALLLTGAQRSVPWLKVPMCAKKGHLQPQNRKENKKSLWEHVDGESRQRCEQKRAVTAKADRILMFPSQSQDARIRGDRSSAVCPCFSFFLLNFAGIWENSC